MSDETEALGGYVLECPCLLEKQLFWNFLLHFKIFLQLNNNQSDENIVDLIYVKIKTKQVNIYIFTLKRSYITTDPLFLRCMSSISLCMLLFALDKPLVPRIIIIRMFH